jgi:hypothetical protein
MQKYSVARAPNAKHQTMMDVMIGGRRMEDAESGESRMGG